MHDEERTFLREIRPLAASLGMDMFVTRQRIPSGCRKAPTFHVDDRVAIVLDGTLLVGFGDRFDEQALIVVSKGSTWTIPARKPYFLWARDGEVLLQVMGNG